MWHGFSCEFHVISCHKSTAVWSQLTPFPWPFHVIYPGFICLSICPNTTWISQKFKSWNFHGKNEKLMGFLVWIWCHFRPTAVKETWENQCHIFYRDGMIYLSISYLLFRMEYDPLKSYILFFNFTFHKVIKAFAPMVHANSMCYGQGIRLVNSYIFSRFESILSDLHYNISK